MDNYLSLFSLRSSSTSFFSFLVFSCMVVSMIYFSITKTQEFQSLFSNFMMNLTNVSDEEIIKYNPKVLRNLEELNQLNLILNQNKTENYTAQQAEDNEKTTQFFQNISFSVFTGKWKSDTSGRHKIVPTSNNEGK